MTLDETQQLFVTALTTPEAVTAAQLEATFLPSASMRPAERVQVYASMFLWRQVDALREDFPRTADALGEQAFVEACRAYVKNVPSTDPDLGVRGRQFATFLEANPQLLSRPDVADLAQLEWARAEVFYEAAATAVDAGALASLTGDDLVSARLAMLPSLRCLTLNFEVAPLWRALEAGTEAPAPSQKLSTVAVWRPAFDVVHGELEIDEASALTAVLGGATVGDALEAFASREEPAEAALGALQSWFAEGWVVGVR